jgi:hypothetical protein
MQQTWFQQRLAEHMVKLCRVQGTVHFITDGFFVAGDLNDPECVFTLGRGGSFFMRPDHHAITRLWVRSIDEKGVRIDYESRFDHRSFGKNKVTIDRGTVRLPWMRK